MQSTPKPKKSLKIFSIVQLVLGLIFIILLFSVPFGEYYTRTQSTVEYVYNYRYYDFFISQSTMTSPAAAGIAIMYLIFIVSSLRILSTNIFGTSLLNKILTKIAKFTPLLGLGIIGFGLVATSYWEQVLSNIYNLQYGWLREGAGLIFIGGLIVIVTSLVANRLSRPASPIVYGYPGYVPPQPGPSYQQPQVPAQPGYSCPSCGGPLTFVTEYNRWYCYNCKKYQ